MKKYGLVSKYILKHSKKYGKNFNNDPISNKVNREFSDCKPLDVMVSDLTYVKCAGRWHYICLLLDLGRCKIIGSAVGRSKKLVRTAFYGVQADLRRIHLFHTDRGSEFKNKIIEAFGIEWSLSAKGKPIDNAVAESMYNIVKTEMANLMTKTYEDTTIVLELPKNLKAIATLLGFMAPMKLGV